MYCVKCGVKLADTEKSCPLCGTRVFHPDISQEKEALLYPKRKHPLPKINMRIPQVIMTAAFLLAVIVVYLCDEQIHGKMTWSGVVMLSLALGYIVFVLPSWFDSPNPVIFVPISFVAVGGLLVYINFYTEGNWFLSFAFPVTGGVGIIVTTVVVLVKYLKKGKLYIFGGAFIALGCFMMLVELLVNITFNVTKFMWWSLYPLTALSLIGVLLIYFAISRTARELMERKFFI